MPAYFLSEDEDGCSPIKIGVAKNIEVRKRNLQISNPLELRLLGCIALMLGGPVTVMFLGMRAYLLTL